ncbi:MAG: DUF4386 family protein [Anaerolineaceae bacterium]|nr:DUF4386 family protein [Anaerolineaceae bacterium]
MNRNKTWTGILFITGAVLLFLPYNLLIINFNYPDILCEPAGAILTQFHVFQSIHQYGGVTLGEHLGQFFSVVWAVLVCVTALRTRLMPPWLAWWGIGASAIYFMAQTELLATVMPGVPVVPEAGLVGSTLWLLWLIGLGIALLRTEPVSRSQNLVSVSH